MGAEKRFSITLAQGADPAAPVLGALAMAAAFAREVRLAPEARARLAVVVEEIVSNAACYGRAADALELSLTVKSCGDQVALLLEDNGIAFDPTTPTSFSGPDPESGGGVGLELVRAWASEVSYARVAGRNQFRLMLRLPH